MTDNKDNLDEQLVRNFLQSHRKDMADGGFSQRVMRQLAQQDPTAYSRTALWWSNVLTILTGVLSLLLFFRFDGFERLWHSFEYIFTNQANEWVCNGSLPSILGAGLLLMAIGVSRACNDKG